MNNELNFNAIPEAACRFSGGEVIFRDNGPNAKSAGIRLKARSGQPIDHWFWGRIVHDLSGIRHKPRIAVDYAHNDTEVLGYVNHFDTETNDLILSGSLTPWREDDRASEVIFKMREGVPYEASIFFGGDGIKIEDVPEGMVAQVNGYQFDGPGVIVREWPLRGVAICPYGADANTESAALSAGKTYAAMKVEPPKEEEQEMSEQAVVEAEAEVEAPVAVETAVVEAEAAPVVAPVVELPEPENTERKEFSRMKAEFGLEIASEVFESGGTYEDARAKFTAKIVAENEALRKQIAEIPKAEGGKPAEFTGSDRETGDPWKAAQKKKTK